VLDPFAGLGTVPMRAVMLARRGLGWELSPRYFADAVYYCETAERKLATPNLFDMLKEADGNNSLQDLQPAAVWQSAE